ncbi:MAG: M43 family zinc metalloprotease [Bacteroidia bacterium]|nr:M43 family zinc metalloprotease [Bacteroidia bacterium]
MRVLLVYMFASLLLSDTCNFRRDDEDTAALESDCVVYDAGSQTYNVKVVFNLVLPDAESSKWDTIIHEEMNILNCYFNRIDTDAEIKGIHFSLDEVRRKSTGTEFEFFGEERLSSKFKLNEVKSNLSGIEAKDPNKYINIWICVMNGDYNGFAFLPEQLQRNGGCVKDELDGIVIDFKSFGTNSAGKYRKTIVHEMGHYFGLKHPTEDAYEQQDIQSRICEMSITKGDGIDDTRDYTKAEWDELVNRLKNITDYSYKCNPEERNHMIQGTPTHCQKEFTEMQVETVH